MPYRRLPNTDACRIRTLERAVAMDGFRDHGGELVLSYQTTRDTAQFLGKYKNSYALSIRYRNQLSSASKNYAENTKMARLYVSHFLQVLIFAVLRGEVRKETLSEYGIDPNATRAPRVNSEKEIIKWGQKIIKAEEERIKKGGIPIYNPTIAKVKVHYSIFEEQYYNVKNISSIYQKHLSDVAGMRDMADNMIVDIWNQVYAFYEQEPPATRQEKYKSFGIIFYTAKKERNQKKAEILQNTLELEMENEEV